MSILGCEYGDKIRATVPCSTKPVTGYALDVPTNRQCKGEVTAVVIQGKNDNVVGPANGPKTRDFYAALNHCGTMTTPVMGYTDTLSNCVMYQGCDADYPVYWVQSHRPQLRQHESRLARVREQVLVGIVLQLLIDADRTSLG